MARLFKSKRPQSQKKTFTFISPDGEIYADVRNFTEFSERFGLHYSGFSKLSLKKLKTYRGWKML